MNKTLKRVGAGALLVFAFLVVIAALPGEKDKEVEGSTDATPMAFDVPSLIGKNLANLRSTLGVPDQDTEPTEAQVQAGIETWEKSWKKDGYVLMATYDVKTKAIVDLFLGADSDAANAEFRDTKNILRVGNLSTDAGQYSIEFVKARNTSGYTGAIIRAK
ncbi:MAG TPA: hypothetical protein VJ553_04080 [Candidatus Paceibacterota bacterium]|nr:hypothetical protein [Candidatus Paceibacterota bacterium]